MRRRAQVFTERQVICHLLTQLISDRFSSTQTFPCLSWRSKMNKKLWQILSTLMIVALLAAACAAPATNPPATSVPSPTPASVKIGGTVNFLGVWGGSELDNFMAVIKPFEEATGIKVEY